MRDDQRSDDRKTASLGLSITLGIMASLSSSMLGLGQRSVVFPSLTILAAATSVVFTDGLGWFRLHRVLANLAMLLAAFASLHEFFQSGSQQQLLAVARLLMYVQMVLLFQVKSYRVYGQLMTFSLLQVVVAALLSQGLAFALLLVLYLVVAASGGVLFCMYREVEQVGMVTRRRFWFPRPAAAADQLDDPGSSPPIQVLAAGPALVGRVWTWRILPLVGGMACATMLFTGVFFFTSPRTGSLNWQRGAGGRNLVGFSSEVTLDQMGQLLRSDERVMRVSFTDAATGAPYKMLGAPYLRGSVLTRYDPHARPRWQREITGLRPLRILDSSPLGGDLVRQDILLEPTGSNLLFSLYPAYAVAETPADLRVDRGAQCLVRTIVTDKDLSCEYRYVLVTTGCRFGLQRQVVPSNNEFLSRSDRYELEATNRWTREISHPVEFPRLIALAAKIVRENAPGGNSYERARSLEAHFIESQDYRYTLDLRSLKARRRPEIDPIEDFVSNHRSGHCEYFASALTLMLRSQGIPARMAMGYRPDASDDPGGAFEIRQYDAHAWVEAYLELKDLPSGMLDPAEQHTGGGWLRLDPTPSGRGSDAGARIRLWDRAGTVLDHARWLWNDYVVQLTEERQKQAILDPLALDGRRLMADLVDVKAWSASVDRTLRAQGRGLAEGLFSWRAGLAAILACAACYGAYRGLRSAGRGLSRWKWLRRVRERKRRPQTVVFYRQLESALARLGLHRQATQTQRQFATAAARHLATRPQYAALTTIPHEIVDAFYQLRFGHRPPSPRQEAEIHAKLRQLQQALAN